MVYDVLGREVATLIDDLMPPGYSSVEWDGRDGMGNQVVSGVYLYKMVAVDEAGHNTFEGLNKMILLK